MKRRLFLKFITVSAIGSLISGNLFAKEKTKFVNRKGESVEVRGFNKYFVVMDEYPALHVPFDELLKHTRSLGTTNITMSQVL